MEFKKSAHACMRMQRLQGLGLSLSLSLHAPQKVCSPLDKEAPSSSLSLSVTTKGAEIQNLHCLCSQRN